MAACEHSIRVMAAYSICVPVYLTCFFRGGDERAVSVNDRHARALGGGVRGEAGPQAPLMGAGDDGAVRGLT